MDIQDGQDYRDGTLLQGLQPDNCNLLFIRDLLWVSQLQFPHYIPLCEKESTGPFGTLANSYDRDDSPGSDRDHGSTERAGHSGFPQAAGPAVPEREIGAGRVSGCSGMPGAWKSQPAPGRARGIRGQDTVERHGGLDPVMEKIDQPEQENANLQRPRNDRRFPPPGVKDVPSYGRPP